MKYYKLKLAFTTEHRRGAADRLGVGGTRGVPLRMQAGKGSVHGPRERKIGADGVPGSRAARLQPHPHVCLMNKIL